MWSCSADKLPYFIDRRRQNFEFLADRLQSLEQFLDIARPTPSNHMVGFPITIREEVSFSRRDVTKYLDQHNIGSRLLFAGN